MKNKTHYFITNSGCIHAYYPEANKSTFKSEKTPIIVIIDDEYIIKFDDKKETFVLFDSLKALISELKGLNNLIANEKFFVDCDGIFHRINTETNEYTYLPTDTRMIPHIEKVKYTGDSYEQISFIDPQGIIADTEAYVLWDDLEALALEIDK